MEGFGDGEQNMTFLRTIQMGGQQGHYAICTRTDAWKAKDNCLDKNLRFLA